MKRRVWISGLVVSVAAASGLAIGNFAFPTESQAAVSPGGTGRMSVDSDEQERPGDSTGASISADGRYVAFATYAPLDPFEGADDKEPDLDVYVRDTVGNSTMLVSHGRSGGGSGPAGRAPGLGISDQPSISGDGRYIAFHTNATNIPVLRSGDHDKIVVCDRDPDGDGTFDTACRQVLVSGTDERTSNPKLAADGALVSYEVAADITVDLLRTTPGGAVRPPDGPRAAATDGPSASADPSPDPSGSGDPSPDPSGPDGEPVEPDNTFGDEDTGWIELVSLTTDGAGLQVPRATDHVVVEAPDITLNGTTVPVNYYFASALAAGGTRLAFAAGHYTYVRPNAIYTQVVWDYDVATGDFDRLDTGANGNPLPGDQRRVDDPALSGDGRRYAFTDYSDSNGRPVLRLYDRDPEADGSLAGDGVPRPTEIASRTTAGENAVGGEAAFSADGRYLAFVTPSLGMHNGVDDGPLDRGYSCLSASESSDEQASRCDVVVRDLVVDAERQAADPPLPRLAAELASPSIANACRAFTEGATCEGNDDSRAPVLAANGSAVAFDSEATDLVERDLNRSDDVYQRVFTPGLTGKPVDLGTVPIGSAAIKDAVVEHVGYGPVAVQSAEITGLDAVDFAIFPADGCTGVTLHATQDCTISVRFQPTAVGPRQAVLRVTPARGAAIDIALTGTADPAPVGGFGVDPAAVAFGSRGPLHRSPVKPVTVTNTGTGPLVLGAVTLTGAAPADYQITANTCANATLAPAATCRIDVRHRPVAVGARNAVLRIDHSGTLSGTVALTGTGLAPEIKVAPNVVKAGDVSRLVGLNFPPNSSVTVAFRGLPVTLTAKAKADGSFDTQMLVMAHVDRGVRPLAGTVVPASAPGLAGPLEATIDVLIVRGALQPPDYIFRN